MPAVSRQCRSPGAHFWDQSNTNHIVNMRNTTLLIAEDDTPSHHNQLAMYSGLMAEIRGREREGQNTFSL
jgi:hypothetical protein